jgi:hypothetical protein
MLQREGRAMEGVNTQMRDWISKQLGSDEWERLVVARRLKVKQQVKAADYDPDVVP